MTELLVYKELAGVIRAASDAIVALVDGVKHAVVIGSEGYDHIVASKHRKHLVDLSARASDLSRAHQMVAARSIDDYLADPNPLKWFTLKLDLGEILERIQSFLEEVRRERSDFVLESAYGVILESLSARTTLVERMKNLHPPETPEELTALAEINSDYKRLLGAFSEAIAELNAYLKDR